MRKLLIISAGTLAHLVLTLVTFFAAFGAGMGRFDTGTSATAFERLLDGATVILLSPIVMIVTEWLPREWWPGGIVDYLLFAANSLLWSIAGYYLVRAIRSRRKNLSPGVGKQESF